MSMSLSNVIYWLPEYEASYNLQVLVDYTRSHAEIPIFAVCAYLGFIFWVPTVLKKPVPHLRTLFMLWNLVLAAFSILGASRVVPLLLSNLMEKGFNYTVCENPSNWYFEGGPGLWVGLFIYSKLPELADTAFLVLQKKPVIFLHWFHHATVLLYCWHSLHNMIAPGIWFAAMNYCVHSIMYLYYFLAIAGFKRLARPIAPYITTIQIVQMVGGIIVTVWAGKQFFQGGVEACYTDSANVKLGLGMYACYFVLFAVLYYNNYLAPSAKHKAAKGAPRPQRNVCDVGDGAGFFHGKKQPDTPVAKKQE